MKIGIIGAGNIGGNLAELLVRHGHDVSIANSRGPETLTEVAARTGATPVTAAEAPRDAEVVIVTIPLGAVKELPKGLLDTAADDAVVIDTNNYYPQRDGRISALEEGETSSSWVQGLLGRPVVKAFNNIASAHLLERAQEPGTPNRRALPLGADDEAAKARVVALVNQIGFEPYDAGTLADSWRYQPDTPPYGPDVDVDGLRDLLAQSTR